MDSLSFVDCGYRYEFCVDAQQPLWLNPGNDSLVGCHPTTFVVGIFMDCFPSELIGLCWGTLNTCMFLNELGWVEACWSGPCSPTNGVDSTHEWLPNVLGNVVELIHVLQWLDWAYTWRLIRWHFSSEWDCVKIPSLWYRGVWDSHDVLMISNCVTV